MIKSLSVIFAAVIAGSALVGSATDASAGRRHGCCGTGPIPPVYHTKHKTVHKHITRYRDVSRTHYVHRTRRIIHVLKIRPVLHVHKVLRVHHHKVAVIHNKHQHVTKWLPRHKIVTRSVQNFWDCRCHY